MLSATETNAKIYSQAEAENKENEGSGFRVQERKSFDI
jgi:hypothetical protein